MQLTVNKNAISDWMFRDMTIHYADHIFREVQKKYVEGDINTQTALDSVDYLIEILDSALPGDAEKDSLMKELIAQKKTLDHVMNDVI